MNITLTLDNPNRSACARIAGDLDYVTTRTVVENVSRLLAEQSALRLLRLDCSALTFCDSAGLSGLLDIYRQTSRAGVRLQLADRPPHLERILQITGTLEYFAAACDAEATRDRAVGELSGESEIVGSRGERNA
jgi:anti-anti-sigma factor